RIIVRSALALMMLLPLAVGLQLGQMGSPDKSAAPEGRVEQEVGGADDQERPAAEWQTHGREFGTAPEDLARSRRIGSSKRSAAPKDGAPAARDPAGSPLSDDGERPFAESAPPAPTTDSGAPARRSAEAPPAAGATPPPEESDWDVVPV